MKTLKDLQFGFECALGLDDRKYTLEEVLEKVDKAMLDDHNTAARLFQEVHQYRIFVNRLKYELKDAQRYCEIDTSSAYMRGRRDTLEILLGHLNDWLGDRVNKGYHEA